MRLRKEIYVNGVRLNQQEPVLPKKRNMKFGIEHSGCPDLI